METTVNSLATIPHGPGVYIYRSHKGTVLYVGKAVDLSKRVHQYFAARSDAVGEKTESLVSQIARVETIETFNEFDALLLEAKLIRQYNPKYNVIAKDDKSPLYICLTMQERLPRVQVLRRTNLPQVISTKGPYIYGPFQSGRILRELFRRLRHVTPYCMQKQRNGCACFYSHLSLCNPCPSYIVSLPSGESRLILERLYRAHIRRLSYILSGKSLHTRRLMEIEMRRLAKGNKFEEAEQIKKQIESLVSLQYRRFDPHVYTEQTSLVDDVRSQELQSLRSTLLPYIGRLKPLLRIECVDISHIQGKQATASLVVLVDGIIDTSSYRRFTIRRAGSPSDVDMMREVIGRRFAHADWPMPDLLVLDGGKAQVSTIRKYFLEKSIKTPLIGLAKRFEEIVVSSDEGSIHTLRLPMTSPAIHILQRIRDEAHRFARAHHMKLRKKLLEVF